LAAPLAWRSLFLAYVEDTHFVSIAYAEEGIIFRKGRQSMRNFLWDALAFDNPRDRRSERAGDDEAKRSYPKPAEMLLKIGALILVAVCVGLAVDYLVHALGH
jgi:hypothetical protein